MTLAGIIVIPFLIMGIVFESLDIRWNYLSADTLMLQLNGVKIFFLLIAILYLLFRKRPRVLPRAHFIFTLGLNGFLGFTIVDDIMRTPSFDALTALLVPLVSNGLALLLFSLFQREKNRRV